MMEEVRIGKESVGKQEPAFVIAEVGSNHDQKIGQAKRLIDIADETGADAVKFQLYKAEDLYPSGTEENEALSSTELPPEWVPRLAEHARGRGLYFLASPFSRSAIDRLVRLQVPALKWASSETVDLAMLSYAASRSVPLIISTGMCNAADVYEAVEVARSVGNDELILLQCTSVYPAKPSLINLRVMDAYRSSFGYPVGLSDHTMGTAVPVAAAARGAAVIEKHITVDRSLDGPDHHYALESEEFGEMVQGIRAAERALGSSVKKMLDEEAKQARRSSLHAAQKIEEGDSITKDHFVAERPAGGIPPRFRQVVTHSEARVEIQRGEDLTWDKINVK